MDKVGMAVVIAFFFGAVVALGSWLFMLWSALSADLFGFFAPIGFWDSVLYFALTSSVIGLLMPRAKMSTEFPKKKKG